MSKIVPLRPFGVPVNSAIPTANHIVAYYGPSPLDTTTKDASGLPALYSSKSRIDCGAISSLPAVKDAAGANVWSVDVSAKLPTGLTGKYDFVFTDADGNGDESDFSPAITATVDTVSPLALGQPVQL